MTLAEEKALLARFAKAAGAGEMLNIHDLKAGYQKAIGHATSDSTVYNLLHRHGWRKLMPRPFHSKRDSSQAAAVLRSLAQCDAVAHTHLRRAETMNGVRQRNARMLWAGMAGPLRLRPGGTSRY